jgi:hypothetical protein
MANAEALLVYWPAAAAVAAFFTVLLSVVWIARRVPKLAEALGAIAKSRKELDEARPLAKVSLGKVKLRRAEMQALHRSAGKLFWRTEKTWIG